MSLLDYAELSKIRILLVPLGDLDSESFQKHVEDISCIDRIPLQELSQPINNSRSNYLLLLFYCFIRKFYITVFQKILYIVFYENIN